MQYGGVAGEAEICESNVFIFMPLLLPLFGFETDRLDDASILDDVAIDVGFERTEKETKRGREGGSLPSNTLEDI